MIKVGAATEVELKEKKHRIEDAVSATRAAIEEGIVPGGGSALIHAVSVLDDDLGLTGDEAVGVRVVRKAADEPLRWIAENGGVNGYVVDHQGPRARRRQRLQRRHRASTATWSPRASSTRSRSPAPRWSTPPRSPGMLLTTETLIVEKPEEEEPAAAAATVTATATDRSRSQQHPPARQTTSAGPAASSDRPQRPQIVRKGVEQSTSSSTGSTVLRW